jgi:hypothetical protein
MERMNAVSAPLEAGAAATVDDSHRLQAASLWRRWRERRLRRALDVAAPPIPASVPLPEPLWVHYRQFAWVVCEQRLAFLILAFLFAAVTLVASVAWHLQAKPPLVVRALPSLKEEAAAFYGDGELSYDQLAFFLHGCLPLLFAEDEDGHPLLPLAEGLVAPEIYRAAERRLGSSGLDVAANRMTQTLALTAISQVVTDTPSGRAAAYVRGYLTVTMRQAEAVFYPWRGRVVLAVNPGSRLNPYPFYLLALDERTGPEALEWDRAPDLRAALTP